MEGLSSQRDIGVRAHTEMPSIPKLKLGFGTKFADLYSREGALHIDSCFLAELTGVEPLLAERLVAARHAPDQMTRLEESQMIIEMAPHLEDFIGQLFGIQAEVRQLDERHHEATPLFYCKRMFVQRKAMHKYKAADAVTFDGDELAVTLLQAFGSATNEITEILFARHVNDWLNAEDDNIDNLDIAMRYAAWATLTEDGKRRHGHGVLFRVPTKLDFKRLVVPIIPVDGLQYVAHRLADDHLRERDGFTLTDKGINLTGALGEANYCIWCHEQGKDSCSVGLQEKKGIELNTPRFKKNTFNTLLTGCPVDEKISEFHKVKASGFALSALAVITIDNPMCAATGHRICNDCMKSCIYQKQEPVNIPETETRTLKDVLELPWGFEIYSLLTRWNPLDLIRPIPKLSTGRKVLVVGMGPAGYTLSHHLMNDGHTVMGIDGLKIEFLPSNISGVDQEGRRVPFKAIRDASELDEDLNERMPAGFGGVAEYGITVRWNKNFLKLIRLLLERRAEFSLFGGVRFGGTITADDAFAMGFDHVALAAGAGRPTVLDLPNGLARGVRAASDFLMALQLSGAAQMDSVANMQLRLPVVVIGGGLTAIDTATEALAYYPVQVAKFLNRYEILVALQGKETIHSLWDEEEREIAEEFLDHARAIRAEREASDREGRVSRVLELLQSWGGATIAYRKRLIDSPSYTLNHEEVEKALEEGIFFAEDLTPERIEIDQWGHVQSVHFLAQVLDSLGSWKKIGVTKLSARAVLVAAGTQPNTVLAREDEKNFKLDGRYFAACDEDGSPVNPIYGNPKPETPLVLLSRCEDGRFISFFGDLHPSYSGNVVKAMSSAKQGYPVVSRVLKKITPKSEKLASEFFTIINDRLRPRVHEIKRLTPTIIEVVVYAPMAAKNFRPGQFYRFQNFGTLATTVNETKLAMEGIALTGASVDISRGLVSLIALEMGGSADLCALLKPGDPVILMGPTGAPTEILSGETVVLVGGGLGNAVLFSIGEAARSAGSRILYFAGYKKIIDRYKVAEIEAAADTVVWCCDESPGFEPSRLGDLSYVGNIVDAMMAYATGAMGSQPVPLMKVDRIIAIGSDRMMAAVGVACRNQLNLYLKADHFAIGSINSPMQCMMKEICAQCLQPHKDPITGEITYVFSCFNQDQPLDRVDFCGLASRLKQNSVQEKITVQWISYCLKESSQLKI